MADFISSFRSLSEFNNEAAADLHSCLSVRSYDKGELLLKSQETCKKLYFIDQGLIKIFFIGEDREFIMRFFSENMLFTVVNSFVTQAPSQYMIMALERTTVTYVTQADLESLCKSHHGIETAFRRQQSTVVINMMKRISEMLEESATERYNHFIKDYPQILHRISLGDLANYLGITQVSLSRIRANK